MALLQIFWTMHICAFFVSLDQLLCNNQPTPPPSSFTTIRKGTDLFGIFLFTKLPLVKGHCPSLHLLSVLLWKVYFVLTSENKTQPFSWCNSFINKQKNGQRYFCFILQIIIAEQNAFKWNSGFYMKNMGWGGEVSALTGKLKVWKSS